MKLFFKEIHKGVQEVVGLDVPANDQPADDAGFLSDGQVSQGFGVTLNGLAELAQSQGQVFAFFEDAEKSAEIADSGDILRCSGNGQQIMDDGVLTGIGIIDDEGFL